MGRVAYESDAAMRPLVWDAVHILERALHELVLGCIIEYLWYRSTRPAAKKFNEIFESIGT